MTASQNNSRLTITDSKSAAALHNISSEETFVEECAYQVTSPIVAPFSEPTYKVRTQMDHFSFKLQSDACILDTGGGLNIINTRLIQTNWSHKAKSPPTTMLRGVTRRPTTLLGTILLFKPIRSLHVRFWFEIV